MDPEALPLVAKQVAKFLVGRKFNELATASRGVHLSAEALQDAVDEISAPLVMPPERVWEELDVTAVPNSPGRFFVVFDLWTRTGRTDWSVELTLYSKHGKPVIEVENIHAL